ncbi:uncharacterized protein LOC129940557 [Eupeodes corollae]|uniref:uncharacterized protein LOC129940557 n=1 Tax=Eupeodes corollae TaxID=290404 RepID=UPI00248F74E3|nr:uncharacterized protein LOC129940557 [Eupeodes corollae]
MASIVVILFLIFLGAHFQISQCDGDILKAELLLRLSGCHEKEGVSMEVALEHSSMDLNLTHYHELVEKNPKIKCVMSCTFKFMNLMDGCSVILDSKLKHLVNNESAKKTFIALENCESSITETDPCECAYQVDTCVRKEFKKEKENKE